jgi:hypothetical protein
MSAPALLRKQDMLRAAEVAKTTGCRVEIKVGDAVITLFPEEKATKEAGVDYSRPSL